MPMCARSPCAFSNLPLLHPTMAMQSCATLTRHPDSWDPAFHTQFPYEDWKRDMMNWIGCIEIPPAQRGPLTILKLGGLAREFANDLDAAAVHADGRAVHEACDGGVRDREAGCHVEQRKQHHHHAEAIARRKGRERDGVPDHQEAIPEQREEG